MTGDPKTLTLTEAVMQLGWTGKALHFDPYAGAWLVLRESGQIGARGATWPEAVSDALGGTVVPVDEATEVRLAAKKLLAELSKLAEAYVFEVQHGAVPDAMEALEAALGVSVVARDEAAELRAENRNPRIEAGGWVKRVELLEAAINEWAAAATAELAAQSDAYRYGFDHKVGRKVMDAWHAAGARLAAAEEALQRLAGGEEQE